MIRLLRSLFGLADEIDKATGDVREFRTKFREAMHLDQAWPDGQPVLTVGDELKPRTGRAK